MLTHLCLALLSLAIGTLLGASGIGGFFLPPALTLLTGLSIQQAVAISLFTFIFTGAAGVARLRKRIGLDWRLVAPVCFGAALTAFAGAVVGHHMSAVTLSLVLAVVIVAAGLYTLTARVHQEERGPPHQGRCHWPALLAIGAITGFLSGLTGIGGPALSVPLMMMGGYSVLTAIGVGQTLQIVGALSGTIANLRYGSIDVGVAVYVAAFEIVGVVAGTYVIHRVDARVTRRLVGSLCLIAGCTFIARAL